MTRAREIARGERAVWLSFGLSEVCETGHLFAGEADGRHVSDRRVLARIVEDAEVGPDVALEVHPGVVHLWVDAFGEELAGIEYLEKLGLRGVGRPRLHVPVELQIDAPVAGEDDEAAHLLEIAAWMVGHVGLHLERAGIETYVCG